MGDLLGLLVNIVILTRLHPQDLNTANVNVAPAAVPFYPHPEIPRASRRCSNSIATRPCAHEALLPSHRCCCHDDVIDVNVAVTTSQLQQIGMQYRP